MWFDQTHRADRSGSVPEKPPVVHPNKENSPLKGHTAKTVHALSNAGPEKDAPSGVGKKEVRPKKELTALLRNRESRWT